MDIIALEDAVALPNNLTHLQLSNLFEERMCLYISVFCYITTESPLNNTLSTGLSHGMAMGLLWQYTSSNVCLAWLCYHEIVAALSVITDVSDGMSIRNVVILACECDRYVIVRYYNGSEIQLHFIGLLH